MIYGCVTVGILIDITMAICLSLVRNLIRAPISSKPIFIRSKFVSNFVPKHQPLLQEEIYKFQEFMNVNKTLTVLTGAGISTESGIPDYRSEGVGLYSKSTRRPIRYQVFISNEESRKRYWIRNFVAWPYFSSLKPNTTHSTLNEWQKNGKINSIITQNVDRLHHKAGSENIIELHGASYTVKCLNCDFRIPRILFQTILTELNPQVNIKVTEVRPDGDTEIDDSVNFRVPQCSRCNGILKPDVVFFGETVPKLKVDRVWSMIKETDALLVLGSSLEVYSGFRFASGAKDLGKQLAIINIGTTRADKMANIKIESKCSDLLSKIII